VLPSARLGDVGSALAANSYQVFVQAGQLYAFKVGRRAGGVCSRCILWRACLPPRPLVAAHTATHQNHAHTHTDTHTTHTQHRGCPTTTTTHTHAHAHAHAKQGLAGRLGPIGVHLALLLCLFGTAYSGFGGWKGTAMCPEGGEFLVADAIYPASVVSSLPAGARAVMHVRVPCVRACFCVCVCVCVCGRGWGVCVGGRGGVS
jgi:hypothetical protein